MVCLSVLLFVSSALASPSSIRTVKEEYNLVPNYTVIPCEAFNGLASLWSFMSSIAEFVVTVWGTRADGDGAAIHACWWGGEGNYYKHLSQQDGY